MYGVNGSLDAPPIVIRSDPIKAFFVLILFCAMFALLALGPNSGAHYSQSGRYFSYLAAVFVFLGIVLTIMRLFRPASLEISPSGIVYSSRLRQPQSHSWPDIQSIQTRRVYTGRSGFYTIVDLTLRSPANQLASVGSGWPMGPRDLATLLNHARDRWGKP